MSKEEIQPEEEFDIEKLNDPKEEILVHKRPKAVTALQYQQRLNEAFELILYQKLTQKEFVKIFGEMYDVSDVTARTIFNQCRDILKKRYEQKQDEVISDQLARYQDLLIRAREDSNKRVEREVLWDMSRIMGLDQRKLDITSDGLPLDIKINLSNNPKDFGGN